MELRNSGPERHSDRATLGIGLHGLMLNAFGDLGQLGIVGAVELSVECSLADWDCSKSRALFLSERGPEKVVELSGNCPPSPKRRTNAFSRLSFDFVLDRRASRNRNHVGRSPFCLGRIAERIPRPSRTC